MGSEDEMINAVLFDLDGTLLNRDESVKSFINKQYERLSSYVSHIAKEKYISRFIELDNHGYVWKDKVYQQLVIEFNMKGLQWEDLLQDYLSEFKNHCVPFPNLHSTLEKLKSNNIKLGMITNGYGQFQMDNIKALSIKKYFDTILVSEWEGIKKPDQQIFERALRQLNVAPHQSVFVGDHPENDVRASKNLGMRNMWIKGIQSDTVDADFIVKDLAEIPIIIKRLNEENIIQVSKV